MKAERSRSTVRDPLPSLTGVLVWMVALVTSGAVSVVGFFAGPGLVSLLPFLTLVPGFWVKWSAYRRILIERDEVRRKNFRKVERYYSELELPEPTPDLLDELFPYTPPKWVPPDRARQDSGMTAKQRRIAAGKSYLDEAERLELERKIVAAHSVPALYMG